MGYYDDHSEARYREQKGNKGGIFLASLVGAILGAILVIIAIPALSNRGLLPYTLNTNQNQVREMKPAIIINKMQFKSKSPMM